MVEVCGMISINLSFVDSDTVGQLCSGLKVKVIAKNGDELGINERGELRIKACTPFLGYMNNQEAI